MLTVTVSIFLFNDTVPMEDLYTTTLLQGILNATTDAITVYQAVRNRQGQIVDLRLVMLNEQSAALLGLLPESAVGQLVSELAAKKLIDERPNWLREVAETGEPFERERPATRPDGTIAWLKTSIRRFDEYVVITHSDLTGHRPADQEQTKAQQLSQDRTEPKQAERRIRQQAETLEGIFRTVLGGLVVFEVIRDDGGDLVDLRYEQVSDAVLRDTGLSREQMVGHTLLELFPGSKQSRFWTAYKTVLATGETQWFETHFDSDGINNHTYAQVARLGPDHIISSYQIINDLKQVKWQAELQSNLLTRISESVGVAVSTCEAVRDEQGQVVDFRYLYFNDQAKAYLLGADGQSVVGQTVRTVTPATNAEPTIARMTHVLETGETLRFDDTRADGQVLYHIMARLGDGIVSICMDITAQRQREQEVHLQADLLKNIFDNPLTGTIVFDTLTDETGAITNFRYRLVNETARRLMGLSQNEKQPEGRLASEVGYLQSAPGLFEKMAMVCRTGESLRLEQYFEAGDYWRDMAIARLNDGVVLKFNDITQRKQAERERQQQAHLLQTVIDNAPVGIILAEAVYGQGHEADQITDFRYQITNRFNADVTGYGVEALSGHLISEFFPGWQTLSLFETMVDVVRTGNARHYTEEYDNFGINAWYEYYYSKLDNGVLLTFLDVTKLKEAELRQESQANLLQTVLNNAPTGIVLYEAIRDDTGRIVDFTHTLSNPANEAVTGRATGELIGMSLLENYPTNRDNGFFDDLVQVVETGEPVRRLLDYRAHGINGWYEGFCVKQGDGVLFTYLDVTESQQYRRQLEAANLELHRSNNNLQQFAYVASHDLQEPLRKIQQFGDLLLNEYSGVLEQSGQDYIQRMQASAHRMSLLIKDLLAYSRLTTHREPLRPVVLNTIVAEVLDDLDVSIKESGAAVTVGELPTLPGDAFQLHQLFQNLISNALKFRRTDSSVAPSIAVRSRRVKSTTLSDSLLGMAGLSQSSERWFHEISVQDNGIGFDEKYLDRIFQVFQRLHSKNQFAGSGVGLAICRKVVENHNGAITARSEPGAGTTFRVYLPE